MTHISRPLQIALAAMVLFLALWFVVLRGHSSSSESSGSAASSSAPPAAASSSSAASSGSASDSGATPVYHGAAPGVAGLTRAIAKARGAVAQSQQQAQQGAQPAQSQSNSASGSGSASKAAATQSSTGAAQSTPSAAKAAPSAAAPTKPGVPAMQTKVEAQLKQGKTVAVLFWNPHGTVDKVVHQQLQSAGDNLGGKLSVHVARASQVGTFGSFTRAVQVYSTPTILLINPKGQTSSVTGLTDAFSIEQAVKEVKQGQ